MTQGSRVVLYRRVSALMGRGGDDFHSPEMQTQAMRRHIAPLGMREVAEVEDIDVSGRSFNREGLDKVRTLVEDRQVDAVAVYDLSRLGRNTGESLQFIKWLADRRVALVSTREKIDDTPEGKLALTLWLAMAEMFSNKIGRQWSDVIAHRATQQGKHHGNVPLGYVRGPGGLEVDPLLGPAITDAFHRYAAGEPLGDLSARFAQTRGVPMRRQVIKRALANPVYLGKVSLWGDGGPTKNHTWSHKPKTIVDGAHPPLIDQETFDAVARRHARESQVSPRARRAAHALVSCIVCAECGGNAIVSGSKDSRRYVCSRKTEARSCSGCGATRIGSVVQVVVKEVASHISRLKGDIGTERQRLIRQRQPVDDGKVAAAKLEKVRADMTKLVDRWVSGAVPDHSYDMLMAKYRQDEQEWQRRATVAAVAPPPADPRKVVALGEKLLSLWGEMEPWQQNEGVRLLGTQVVLRRSRFVGEPVADRVIVTFH